MRAIEFLSCAIGVAYLALLIPGPLAVAEQSKVLSGPQIQARFAGKQFTDEVHWRDVYEIGGTLRSISMGKTKTGKWSVQGNELCLDLPNPDGGCFEVSVSGRQVVMTPKGNGLALEGILEPISDKNR